jgi:hypothetical protein
MVNPNKMIKIMIDDDGAQPMLFNSVKYKPDTIHDVSYLLQSVKGTCIGVNGRTLLIGVGS